MASPLDIINKVWPYVEDFIPFGQDAYNAQTQLQINRENQDFSREMYNRQSSDALAQWNRANQYNTPSAQMARFKSAGLNPNLVYGMENLSAPTQVLGSPNGSTSVAPRLSGQLGTQNRLLDAQIKNINADTENKLATANRTNELTYWERETLKKQLDVSDAQINQYLQNIENMKVQAQLLNSQYTAQELENIFTEKSLEDRLSLIQSQAQCSRAEAEFAYRMQEHQLALIAAQTGDAKASAYLKRCEAKLADAKSRLTNEEAKQLEDSYKWNMKFAKEQAYHEEWKGKTQYELFEMARYDRTHQDADRKWRLAHATASVVVDGVKAASNFIP